MKEIMNEIEQRFEQALQSKTGWGKDEVLKLYRKVASDVYLEKMSELMDRRQ